jgi:hypothetical protein
MLLLLQQALRAAKEDVIKEVVCVKNAQEIAAVKEVILLNQLK